MKRLLPFILSALAIASFAASTSAQEKKTIHNSVRCPDEMTSDRLKVHCEIKEQTLPATGALTVDGKRNGGIHVKGWDRNEVLVRSRIQTTAPTQLEADQMATQIRVDTGGMRIHAEGPESRDDRYWFVSYEVFVPRRTDLTLEAQNGGVSIEDVNAKIDFQTQNGGVFLSRVGGAVKGSTTNGGAHVELAGSRWEGEGLNVTTTNGGVFVSVPENYSAHFETGTVNGRISSEFPINLPSDVQWSRHGRSPQQISTNLGSGGATVRVMTTNGGVRISRSNIH